MWKALEIASYVILPLLYGLGVEYLFERLRRKRRPGGGAGEGEAAE